MYVLYLQNLLWYFFLFFREKKGDCLSRLIVFFYKTENIQDQESVFIYFYRDIGYFLFCVNRIELERNRKCFFCFLDYYKFCQYFLLKYIKSSIVKVKLFIFENIFIFFCFLFRLDVSFLIFVGLLKYDYVIVIVENFELIVVCVGSIINILEEEVVLLIER